MLLSMLTLPGSLALDVLKKISIPVLAIYPAVTMLFCMLLEDREMRVVMEMENKEGRSRLQLSNSISQKVLTGASADSIIKEALQKLHELFPHYRVAYGAIDVKGQFHISHSWQPQNMPSLAGIEVDLKKAPDYLAALRSLQPLAVTDITKDPRLAPFAKVMEKGGNKAILDVPVDLWHEPIGLICFDSPVVHEWTAHEIETLTEVSNLLSVTYKENIINRDLKATQEVIDQSSVIMISWRLESGWPVSYLSKNIGQLGYSPKDFYGGNLNFKSIIHPEDLLTLEIELEGNTSKDVQQLKFECRLLTHTGETRWMDARLNKVQNSLGEPEHCQAVFLDDTERKRADRAADESREHFRLLVEGAPEAIFVQTALKFAYLNPAAVKLFGAKDASELIGQPVLDRFHPDFHDQVRERIHQLNEERKAAPRLEQVYLKMDNTPLHVEVTGVPIQWQGKNGALVFFHDIGERLQAEQDKAQLEEQLLQAQKLESVGRLAGGVAHDFNNLLGVIIGYTEMALEDLKPNNPIYDSMKQINSAGLRAKELTRQLLAFGRKQVLQVQTININDVITGFDKMLRRLIGEDIDVETNLKPDTGLVNADKAMMEQILLNLAVNSKDAMPDGGSLSIETDVVELDSDYAKTRPGVEPGPYVMLAVSDSGQGMDKEAQQRLFEPFFTTKPQGKGTGLGLSTVYGIVKQHGGNIWVYSELGQGTTFKIYLPLANAPMTPKEKPKIEAIAVAVTETVLVVEDDETLRAMITAVLINVGYQLLIAQSPEEAQRLSLEHSGQIDLLLTDVVMPQMNGKALHDTLAADRPDMKVLFMSGYTENVIAHRGVLEEGVNFIQKPFTLTDLKAKIREVLSE